MATEESPQRAYRAACPGCGAPVLFRNAQSTHAICGYCQSTVVRDGDTLSRIGKMAEVFNDYSPLQLFASGKWNGKGFTLIGRLQYQYGEGSWSEWIASFDDGSEATLSEDNGAFVMASPVTTSREIPAAEHFRVGATTAINGKSYTVASNTEVALMAAQGELPRLPPLGTPFAMVELRSDDGAVLGIDYGPQVAGGSPHCRWAGRFSSMTWRSRACATNPPGKTRASSLPAPIAAPVWRCSSRPARASPAVPATASST